MCCKTNKCDENTKCNSIIEIIDECFYHLKSKYINHSKILNVINYYSKLTHDIMHEKQQIVISEENDEIDGIKESIETIFLTIAKKVVSVCADLILKEVEKL